MDCRTYPLGTLESYTYVVIFSLYEGKLLFSRHKRRGTFETQGGHIEPGETPLEAAERELFEESGAVGYELRPPSTTGPETLPPARAGGCSSPASIKLEACPRAR